MIELLNIDCLEYMATCKDKQFDLAIIDPGYGIGDNWSKSRTDRFFKKGKLHKYQNESIPSSEYFKELFRISKNQIIWGSNYFTEFLRTTNAWIVWVKGRDAEKTFMSEAELAWTSYKKCMRVINLLWDGARKCEIVVKIHPHQKPVKLYKWLLKKYAKPDFKIIDTHGGLMSIAMACYDFGCDLVCCEIDKKYYDAAVKRFETYKLQMKLEL